jgi:hypothetical protein
MTRPVPSKKQVPPIPSPNSMRCLPLLPSCFASCATSSSLRPEGNTTTGGGGPSWGERHKDVCNWAYFCLWCVRCNICADLAAQDVWGEVPPRWARPKPHGARRERQIGLRVAGHPGSPQHVSAIYNSARVTKFSEFSIVIDTMDYFKYLHPKGTPAAQDMALVIHQAALGITLSLSPGARHRGDTDTENLRRLLSCRSKLEVPPDHVDLFLSVTGTDKTREGPAAALEQQQRQRKQRRKRRKQRRKRRMQQSRRRRKQRRQRRRRGRGLATRCPG